MRREIERLPVHCCCNPEKRLGTVPVRRLPMGVAMFQVMPDQRPWTGRAYADPERVIVTSVGIIREDDLSTVAMLGEGLTDAFVEPNRQYEAVKSAHEPIEVWRRVPGFVEDRSIVNHYDRARAEG